MKKTKLKQVAETKGTVISRKARAKMQAPDCDCLICQQYRRRAEVQRLSEALRLAACTCNEPAGIICERCKALFVRGAHIRALALPRDAELDLGVQNE